VQEGAVADYIPELFKADPDWFGIAIVTVDGHVYQAGDTRQPFSIQSISKAFTYGIALEDKGPEAVAAKVDVEPSGEAFNSISLEPDTGRPLNPMINAGAIASTSLVNGDSGDAKLGRILERFANYAGRPLEVDEAIHLSEKSTGHRNRAIAHLLRNYEILGDDPEDALDAYFRQCSILVTARDLAVMGATLANDGVNPITGVRALDSTHVPSVLAVMASCGMYDYSGNWIHRVGLPAKSGVGGGVVAVLPGQFGLAVFSPPLDPKGNSVRGIAVCEALSRDLGLHMMRVTRATSASVIRAGYNGAKVRSKVNRDAETNAWLEEAGKRIQVFELTGELMFVTSEIVATTVADKMEGSDFLILDLARVTSIDRSASTILVELVESMLKDGRHVIISGCGAHYPFRKALDRAFKQTDAAPVLDCADVDNALELAEDRLLEGRGGGGTGGAAALEHQPLCQHIAEDELALLKTLLEEESFAAGETICEEGQPADKLYFLASGRVSVSVRLDHRRRRRLSAFDAGCAFGESALFEAQTRSADIIADTDTTVYSLAPKRLWDLDEPTAARLKIRLLSNLSEQSMARLRRVNREIRILTQ